MENQTKEQLEERIAKNRAAIESALEMQDLELVYLIVRLRAAQNEVLIKRLNDIKNGK